MPLTDKVRIVAWILWALTVMIGLAGWWIGKDPSSLTPVMGWVTLGAAASEASNVGKRATYKREAVSGE